MGPEPPHPRTSPRGRRPGLSVFLANEQADYRVDEPALTRLARLVMEGARASSQISLLWTVP